MFAHAHAPCRIGIAGGGTDLPAWTSKREGLCLSLAIDLRVHAVGISREDRQVVASYRQRDVAACATEIANGLIRESALLHGFQDSFEVHTLSEVSSRGSGLGVSSAFSVTLAALFSRMASRQVIAFEPIDRALMAARDGWTVEIDRLRRPIGRQDHMAAACGGLRLYVFVGDDARVERTFSAEDAEWVAKHLALVELPEGHDSRSILSGVKTVEQLQAARDAVPMAVVAIERRDAALLGDALSRGQASKSAIPGAVTEGVGKVIDLVRAIPGVLGCKVAGAGGGGHLVVAMDDTICVREVDRDVLGAIRDVTGLACRKVRPAARGVTCEGWSE